MTRRHENISTPAVVQLPQRVRVSLTVMRDGVSPASDALASA